MDTSEINARLKSASINLNNGEAIYSVSSPVNIIPSDIPENFVGIYNLFRDEQFVGQIVIRHYEDNKGIDIYVQSPNNWEKTVDVMERIFELVKVKQR